MSESDFAKTLTFYIKAGEREADFAFTLGEPEKDSERQLVVTKALHVGPEGRHTLQFSFTGGLAFFAASVEQGDIVKPTYAQRHIKVGERTKLELSGEELSFTYPEDGSHDEMIAENKTGKSQNLGLGFGTGEGKAIPMYCWEGVPDSTSVAAGVPLVLRGYATARYKEGQIFKSETPRERIFELNLREQPESSVWDLFFDDMANRFLLEVHV